MHPWLRSDDGPRPDRAVVADIHRLDPTVHVVWRNYQPDLVTGRPLVTEDGLRLPHPRWWIVKRCHDGEVRKLFNVQHFDYRVPYRMYRDVGRFLDAKEINDKLDTQHQQEEESREAAREQDKGDFIAANSRKLGTVFEGDNLKRPAAKRDETIFSYPGQPTRTAGRESIMPSAKEAGWEMPPSMENEADQ